MKEEIEEDRIAKAFNAGYWMQKHEPNLLKKITTADNIQNDYVGYMVRGAQHADLEIIKEYQQTIKEKQKQKKRGR